MADGGVDLAVYGAGKTTFVQCKHWKARKVGVGVVRELLGAMTHEKAGAGMVVTSGAFTTDAQKFAQENRIQLVNGPALTRMLAAVQRPSAHAQSSRDHQPAETPRCPKCGSAMMLRTARKGANAGSQFYGCTRFPACKGIRPLAQPQQPRSGLRTRQEVQD